MVSPGRFNSAVSLNILVLVLIGGINTTLGPVIGARLRLDVSRLVNINPWLQEIVYGALSILAVTLLPGGVISLLKRVATLGGGAAPEPTGTAFDRSEALVEANPSGSSSGEAQAAPQADVPKTEYVVECRGVQFSSGTSPQCCATSTLR